MALGPFPLPNFDMPPPPAREPSGLWARMRTRWRRNQLDEDETPKLSGKLKPPLSRGPPARLCHRQRRSRRLL
jgi:hypothetical protein